MYIPVLGLRVKKMVKGLFKVLMTHITKVGGLKIRWKAKEKENILMEIYT